MAEPANLNAGASRPALLIVHVGPPEPADGDDQSHRMLQPCRALGELADVAVISGSILSPELYRAAPGGGDLLTSADVLVLWDAVDADLLPVVAARRREGRITVFEPGARWLSAAGGPAAGEVGARMVAQQLARLADGVQVAGFGLDAQLDAVNPRRARFPSQLWEMPASEPRASSGEQVVIGWIGGRADQEDLAVAVPVLGNVLQRHPQARLAILGDPDLAAVVAPLPADRVTVTHAGSPADRRRFLSEIDLGLIPLAAAPGDRFLSDLPALEYAASGALVVCAESEAFAELVRPEQTGLLFRDAAEMEAALDRALTDGELRAAIVARARQAAATRLERPNAANRLAFYLSLAAQRGIRWPPRGGQSASAWLEAAGDAVRFPGSNYAALGSRPVERLLVEGARLRGAGDLAEAGRAFSEAERLAPELHLPPLLLADALPDDAQAIDALTRAEARRPTSCRAAYQRGLRELARGDQTAAAAAFERAYAAAPAFGLPQERLGQLAESAGRVADAVRLYEEAALQNPSFALPVARLALQAQRRGEIGRAVALLERAVAADPDLPLAHFLLGRAYLELGRLNQARAHLERAVAADPAGWPTEVPAGFPEVAERAATLEALARAEDRG